MAEEGTEADEFLAVIAGPDIGGAPRVPDPVRQGMGGGAEAEDVEDHGLHIAGPGDLVKALFGAPAHGHGLAAVHEPVPVRREIEGIGEGADLLLDRRLAVEIALAEECAHDEQGGVHVGEFAVPFAFTARNFQKMVIKALVEGGGFRLRVLSELPEEAQGFDGAFCGLCPCQHPVFNSDGKGGEGVAGRSDAARPWRGIAIRRKTGLDRCGVDEITEGAPLDLLEEGILARVSRGRLNAMGGKEEQEDEKRAVAHGHLTFF